MAAEARRRAARFGLELLERRYGNPATLRDGSTVISATRLETAHLRALFRHEACALVVRGFVAEDVCVRVSEALLTLPRQNWKVSTSQQPRSGGLQSSPVSVIGGTPFNMAISRGADAMEDYFATSRERIADMRKLCGGWSPFDQLRVELDEAWEKGAHVTHDKLGRPMLPGLGRVMTSGGSAAGFVHVDDLNVTSPLRGAFSANIYLRTPPRGAGGELDVWPVRLQSRAQFYRNAYTLSALLVQEDEGQERLRAALGPPETIAPRPGDLVMLCVQRPHAARGIRFPPAGSKYDTYHRVSMQGFVSYEDGKPLTLES